MPLHLRRYQDLWPDQGWGTDQYAIINEEGYTIGTIQRPGNAGSTDPWSWHINGEVVARDVSANGHAPDIETAKKRLAENWRTWLQKHKLGEDHQPQYGRRLSLEDRRRLMLPVEPG